MRRIETQQRIQEVAERAKDCFGAAGAYAVLAATSYFLLTHQNYDSMMYSSFGDFAKVFSEGAGYIGGTALSSLCLLAGVGRSVQWGGLKLTSALQVSAPRLA